MNVLACARSCVFHEERGGMELAAHKLYKGLVKNGCYVLVLTTSLTLKQPNNSARTLDGVKYLFLSGCTPKKYSDEYYSEIVNYFSQSEIAWSIIHSTSGGAKSLARNSKNVPVAATWHGTFLEEQLDKFSKYMYVDNKNIKPSNVESFILDTLSPFYTSGGVRDYTDFDHHFVISKYMKRVLAAYGIKESKISVVPNPISGDFFEARKISKGDARDFFGIQKTEKITIGFVGRLIKIKGYELFIEAVNRLDPDIYDIVFFGSGDSLDLSKLRLDVVVKSVAHEYMPMAYRCMDVFINPTYRYSGFDLTNLESLACGIFCISSSLPQYKIYYEDNEGGKFSIFNMDDVDSLVSSINRIDFDCDDIPLDILSDEESIFSYFYSLKGLVK